MHSTLKSLNLALLPAVLCLAACSATPEMPGQITATVLAEGTQSWDGADFAYPPGDARLTVTRILMPRGSALPMHCHPVPLAGEVVQGPLEVRKENGETYVVGSGEGLIEVSQQWHYGTALADVEILVVYAGAEGVPLTVFKDSDPQWTERCR